MRTTPSTENKTRYALPIESVSGYDSVLDTMLTGNVGIADFLDKSTREETKASVKESVTRLKTSLEIQTVTPKRALKRELSALIMLDRDECSEAES